MEIKPCPFCGNKPEVVEIYEYTGLHKGGWTWLVRCNYLYGGCGARGPSQLTEQEAIEKWNNRWNNKTSFFKSKQVKQK